MRRDEPAAVSLCAVGRLLCGSALLACGANVTPELAQAPVCGEAGPRLLLALPEREYVERVELQDGDAGRLLLETVVYDGAVPHPHELGRRLFVADACGDAVRELGSGLELADVGDVVLACDGDMLLRIDPITGAAVTIVDEVACAGWVGDAGVLAVRPIDERWGTLLLADADGIAPPQTLVPELRLPTETPPAANPFALVDGHVLALDRDGVLLALDVEGGELERVREGVADFRASEDLRWLLVQAGVPDDPDPLAIGPIVLLDREEQREVELLDARLSWTRLAFFGPYVAVRSRAWGEERLFTREGGEPIAMPEGAALRHVLPDDRIVYAVGSGDWRDLDLRTWDPATGEHTPLVRGAGLVSFAADGLERFTPDDAHGLQLGRLTLLPWDGGDERELVAQLAWPYVRRSDGAILSHRDEDGDGLGELRLYPDGEDAVRLADDAYAHDPSLSRAQAFAPDVVFHGVRGGERGFWRMGVSP